MMADLSCQPDCIWNQLKYKELGTFVRVLGVGAPSLDHLRLKDSP